MVNCESVITGRVAIVPLFQKVTLSEIDTPLLRATLSGKVKTVFGNVVYRLRRRYERPLQPIFSSGLLLVVGAVMSKMLLNKLKLIP
jgi:TATA-box binding protein (TBP) (component of TFIID and TFIIIB)